MLNLGRSISVLIAGRILQGLSAAIVWCAGLSLVADNVDKRRLGQSASYIFMAMSAASIAGPLLSGIIFERAGYNTVFAIAYGLIGIDIAMRLSIIEKKHATIGIDPEPKQYAKVGLSLHQTGQPSIAPGYSLGGNASVASEKPPQPQNEVARAQEPEKVRSLDERLPSRTSLPAMVTLLKSKRLICALWATFAASTLITQFDSVLPLYVQRLFDWQSTAASLMFLPLAIPTLLSPVIGLAIDRFGPRWFGVAGFGAFGLFEVLLRLVSHNSTGQKIIFCFLLTGVGIAFNLCTPPLMVEIAYVVQQKEQDDPSLFGSKGLYAQAYGLFNLACAIGALIGPIWSGFVQEKAGWSTMTWSMALLSFVTAVPVAIWTGRSITDSKESNQQSGGDRTTRSIGMVA